MQLITANLPRSAMSNRDTEGTADGNEKTVKFNGFFESSKRIALNLFGEGTFELH